MSDHDPRSGPGAPWAIALLIIGLAGCAGPGRRDDDIPPEIARIPDAVPRIEPLARSGNAETYIFNGRRYVRLNSARGYVEYGLASWYGEPFQGRLTSSGEPYDRYGMTAAHRTLPLPSYVRITNLNDGRQVVVRVNDRGPFKEDRLIDLSYAAAVKLGIKAQGKVWVRVEGIEPRSCPWPWGWFCR